MATPAGAGSRGKAVVDVVLAELRRRRVRIRVEGGALHYDAPRDALDEGFLAVLREHRAELIDRLSHAGEATVRLTPFTGPGDRVIFVFPAAGSGPSAFRSWRDVAPPGTEIVLVHLPGREDRVDESPFTRAAPLADQVAKLILGYGERPFALFGHCMGALVGREVVRRLGDRKPAVLAAAAAPPPDAVDVEEDPSDDHLVETLAGWGATPPELLGDRRALSVLIEPLRADLAVMAECRRNWSEEEKLDVPVLALAGESDDSTPESTCAEWARWTDSTFTLRTVAGGHFFPVEQPRRVLATLAEAIVQP
ncbi:alpha/beta fold hydrolase [Amycolatopsis sp. lyj-23]|uniref:alpha/beta fold hydrolase n=1 Tax=Amycolatopsis sp. lyj-23 TaxID=2789283 RepID=UPI003978E3E6